MPVRDLGYRPYEGVRRPPSQNTKVLLRHGLRRAWGSWLVKIAVFAGWLPAVVTLVIVAVRFFVASQAQAPETAANASISATDARGLVSGLLAWQMWLFVTMVTLGAGAAAIADDLAQRAFGFYFAKPVTEAQYLIGRVGAVASWCFLLTSVPALLVVLALTGAAPEGERIDRAGLILPTLIHCMQLAIVPALASVAVSSLARSRALTMSAWLLFFIVPQILAAIVDAIADWPWLRLVSLPALMSVVGDALFELEPASALRWYHALPVLAAVAAGSGYLALQRLRRTEVVA